jgi:hydroxymethylglutaryl-CoA lyase
VCHALLERIPVDRLALHLHDTYGRSLDNVRAGLANGVRIFDASAGGTGGCPYAPGAAGNLATESLIGLLDELGYDHGVDAAIVREAAAEIRPFLSA